jgi:hypothetical protein
MFSAVTVQIYFYDLFRLLILADGSTLLPRQQQVYQIPSTSF